jgi:hypothetical protein
MYTMKKKILAVVAALAIMTVGTTAFAASSPSGSDVDTSEEETTEAEADEEEEEDEDADAAEAAAEYAEATTVSVDSSLGFKVVSSAVKAEVVTAAEEAVADVSDDAELVAVVDLKPEGDYVKGTAVTLTIQHADIDATHAYAVLHQLSDGTWEQLAATVTKDGELTFTTTSFSAFAIVDLGEAAEDIADDATVATTATTAAASTDAGTSPKTGETTPVALFALLACVAGAVACSKKSEKN